MTGGLKRESIEKLIDELDKYNLAETTDDVKGMAFESLLGGNERVPCKEIAHGVEIAP